MRYIRIYSSCKGYLGGRTTENTGVRPGNGSFEGGKKEEKGVYSPKFPAKSNIKDSFTDLAFISAGSSEDHCALSDFQELENDSRNIEKVCRITRVYARLVWAETCSTE